MKKTYHRRSSQTCSSSQSLQPHTATGECTRFIIANKIHRYESRKQWPYRKLPRKCSFQSGARQVPSRALRGKKKKHSVDCNSNLMKKILFEKIDIGHHVYNCSTYVCEAQHNSKTPKSTPTLYPCQQSLLAPHIERKT